MPTIRKLFLLKLIVGFALAAAAVAGVHTVQAGRIPDALKAQADRAAADGKPDRAVHYLRHYLEFVPADTAAQEQLAGLIRARSANPTADQLLILDKILRADPDRLSVRKDALAAAVWLGRYTEAVGHGLAVVAAEPGNADAFYKLAVAQAALQRTDDAKKSFEASVAADPTDPVMPQRYAQYLWRDRKDPAAARAVLDKLVATLPDSADAVLARARFDSFEAGVTGAVPDLRRALELDPDNAEALAMLADHHQKARQPGLARECLAAGLAKYPADVRMIRGLAWLDLNLGNVGAAVAVLEGGLSRVANGFDLMLPLADLLVQLGETTRSEELVTKLEARPGVAAKMQVAYLKARLAMRAQEWATAAELLTGLRAQAGDLPGLETQANLLLAACHQKQGDPDKEQEALRSILGRDPNHLAARVGLSQSLLAGGRPADALAELEAAAKSPYAGFPVHAQLLRLKARGLVFGGRPGDWAALDAAARDAAKLASPSALDPVLLRAELLAARGDLAPAAAVLRAEAARRPGDPRAWAALADAVANVGGVAAGLAVLDEGQAASGDGAELRLARADLYARDPAALRPIDPLAANVDGWPDADQTRLLYGLIEVFDRAGDEAMVLKTYQRVAARRPADAAVWEAVGERAVRANDAKALAVARANLAKLDPSGKSLALVEAHAAVHAKAPAGPALAALLAKHGPAPQRADVCVVAGTLAGAAGDAVAANGFFDRAVRLDSARLTPAAAPLAAAAGSADRLTKHLARLAADPKWAGEPFRRCVRAAVGRAPAVAPALLAAARPFVERTPGGLGWLGEQYLTAGFPADALTCFEQAAAGPLGTADDDLRLAVRSATMKSPATAAATFVAARAKRPAALYYAAAASYADTPSAPAGWVPETPTPADKKLHAQGRLALKLSRNRRNEAVELLEAFGKDAGPDRPWADRNLAMLLAVRGEPGDRARAMSLLTQSDAAPADTPDEKRSTAAVLTALSRHLDGADRQKVIERATKTLESLVTDTKSPRDAYLLAQVYRASGKYAQSVQVLNSLLAADRRNLEFHVMGLEILTDGKDMATAAQFADQLLALHPADFRAVAAVARYECQAGRPERAQVLAEGYMRTADTAAGDQPAKSARVAELLDELARRPGVRGTPAGAAMASAAAARYEALLAARPDALVATASLLGAANRHADAFALIAKQSAAPARLAAAAGLAAVRTPGATDRQVAQTRAWLAAAAAAEPDSAAVALNAAEFATLTGDQAGAERLYQQVLDADPKNVVALNNLAWLLAPRPAAAQRAADLVNRAVAEVGLTGELLDTRARIRIAAKQFDLAERDLREALAQDKTPLRLFHLALAKTGQAPKSAEATAAFQQAKQHGLEPRSVHPADLAQYRALDADILRVGG